jgi:hypothetical protein
LKYWESIADNLKKCGWSLGWVSAVDTNDAVAKQNASMTPLLSAHRFAAFFGGLLL